MNPVSTMVATKGEILIFSTPKSLRNAFSGIFMYLELVKKYNFAFFQHILCETYDESLQKQAVNVDLLCILWIANCSYAIKTPKDKITCGT